MRVSVPPAGSGGAPLAEFIAAADVRPGAVLFPCAEDRHPDLEAGLQRNGIAVTPVPLYHTEAVADAQLPAIDDAITVFTSPSGVRAYADLSPPATRRVAIGPTTAAAMAAAGVACDAVAAEPTAAALIQSCLEIRNV